GEVVPPSQSLGRAQQQRPGAEQQRHDSRGDGGSDQDFGKMGAGPLKKAGFHHQGATWPLVSGATGFLSFVGRGTGTLGIPSRTATSLARPRRRTIPNAAITFRCRKS